ncbi:adenylyltransferase and sulfurtransferase [Andreprevotia lacus DSM 23236]|jgi:adenylyltransferase/sulfurtransferase|uniref:Adenylyltransferase and sulfurtransferase n=1 Tax=Andreprevotia lacus DSM 23236 TaxID=1121001 RepID=A0A1W1XKD0_9NEIS|nr:molybdopterin-synthase adenylyltransferase MoeB [Andreprevotia lacus]SMC24440.1 adenylyltransferase and sulfurtransferase [Andreprevotia lacus DSM 23236]
MTQNADALDDDQLLRYSRHILLDEIGIEGQQTLAASTALIIGAGGLGAPASLYLAAAGVGRLVIVDHDTVELSNLQRQIVHDAGRLGEAKALSAQRTLHAINPLIEVVPVVARADDALLAQWVPQASVVLDCSDNFPTRHAINRACVAACVPLVSGAAVRFDGQLTSFDLRTPGNPCYHCLFPDEGDASDGPCATFGVFAPLTGLIGCGQAAEALKLLLGVGESLAGRLQLLDGKTLRWKEMRYKRDPACPVCGDHA